MDSEEQVTFDSKNDTNTDLIAREPGKPHVHVAPRIDQDFYQADVPDWCPNYNDNYSLSDSRAHNRSVSSEKHINNHIVKDYLAATRNLFNYVDPPISFDSLWNSSSVDIPLESDVFALEYLASYDYNIDKAYFNIFCDLGCGKDVIYTRKSLGIAERISTGLIFSECKDKLFRVPPLLLLGAYEAKLKATNCNRSDYDIENVHTSFFGDEKDDNLYHNNNINNVTKEYQLFSSLINIPSKTQTNQYLSLTTKDRIDDTILDNSCNLTTVTSQQEPLHNNSIEMSTNLKKKNTKASNVKQQPIDVKDSAIILTNEEKNNTRISKPRGFAANDKLELRKKWVIAAKQVNQLINRTNSSPRHSLQDAQSLLEFAINLPPYFANISASSASSSATDENSLLESSRTLLGELLKSILITRYWISEMRDSIYCCWINAVIYAPSQTRASNLKSNSDSLIGGLKELLKESQSLVLRPEKEEIELKHIISVTQDLLKSSRKILTFCCAWEMKNVYMDVSESFLTSIYSSRVLAKSDIATLDGNGTRPVVYNTLQIKTLLRQYPLGETFYPLDKDKPTMLEVAEFLRLASLNPVKITEVVYIADIYKIGLQQEALAATILTRASQLSSAKSRLTLERTRYSLLEVQSLLQFLNLFPFCSEEVDALQFLLNKAETWRAEVMSLNGEPSPTNSIKNNSESCKIAPKAIPLQKVEALIAEGERLPFEFKRELEILRDKKSQAKVWLEKLKKSFVPSKSFSRIRKSASIIEDPQSEVVPVEKISLDDMKMMVSEGEMLFQPAINPCEDAKSMNSFRTVNRDLDRAMSVVETAEDWISRAREILLRETNEPISLERDEDLLYIDEDDVPEYSIYMLKTMLEEAEGMPVLMEEVNVLKCHLQSLEWIEKVRPYLYPELNNDYSVVSLGNSSPTDEVDKLIFITKHKTKKPAKVGSTKPRLTEIQQFAKEITKIRSSFTGVKNEIHLKPSIEEVKCLETVTEAEKWLVKKKKVQQGNLIRKGIKLSRLKSLYDEGSAINVNFEFEIRPIRSALKSVESWLNDNFLIMNQMELLHNAVDTFTLELIEKCRQNIEINVETVSNATYSGLVELASSASQLLVDFELSRTTQTLLISVDQWLAKVHSILNFCSPSSNSLLVTQSCSIGNNNADNNVVMSNSTNESHSLPNLLFPVEEIDILILEGKNFKINLSEEVTNIMKTKHNAFVWSEDMKFTQLPILINNAIQTIENYDRFIIENLTSSSNCLFSFIHFVDANYQTDKIIVMDKEILCYEHLELVDVQVNSITKQGYMFGVEMPVLRYLLFLSGTFSWIKETRNLLRLLLVSRSKACNVINSDIIKAHLKVKKSNSDEKLRDVIWENWEDLETPFSLQFWGDVDLTFVQALIFEGSLILHSLFKDTSVDNLNYQFGLNNSNSIFSDNWCPSITDQLTYPDSDYDVEDDVVCSSENNEMNKNNIIGVKRKRIASLKLDVSLATLTKTSRSTSASNKNSKSNERRDLNTKSNIDFSNSIKLDEDTKLDSNKGKIIKNKIQCPENKTSKNRINPVGSIDINKMFERAVFMSSLKEISIDAEKQHHTTLSSILTKTIDLWLRILNVFLLRLKALNIWSHKVDLLLQNYMISDSFEISSDRIVSIDEAFEMLLKEAEENSYFSNERVSLITIIENSKIWISKTKNILNANTLSESLLTIEDLTLFIKTGDTVINTPEKSSLAAQLRTELRKAKQWLTKFEKSGASSGGGSSDTNDSLLEDAKIIRVNLSEYTDTIVQSYKTYCLCRNLYFGTMIGCDTCDEWYHLQCVGLNANSRISEKYICIRCSLKLSFINNISNAAQITNKWMNCKEHFQSRDLQFQKLNKRIQKEEKEVNKIKDNTKETISYNIHDNMRIDEVENTDDGTNIHTTDDLDHSISLPITTEVTSKQKEFDIVQSILDKSIREKEILMKSIAAETQLHKEVIRWMQALQELIWPSSEEQVVLGKPIGPNITNFNDISLLMYNRNIVEKLKCLLPLGLVHMEKAASIVGLSEIEDVNLILNIFRWLSWINLALHMLRYPFTSFSLKRLLDATEIIHVKDEKTIKLLNVILQRVGAWKVKVRKIFNSSKSWIDTTKLQSIVLEGNNFPFTSRMKNKLTQFLTEQNSKNGISTTTHSSDDQAVVTTASTTAVTQTSSEDHEQKIQISLPKKRGPKPHNQQVSDDNSYNMKLIDLSISSDEEDEYDQQIITTHSNYEQQQQQNDLNDNVIHRHTISPYENINPQILAADPNITWPVMFKVVRVFHNNNILS